MEHRCGERRELDLTVLVRRRGWRGGVVARARNLSVSGAFLALPRDALPVLSLLRLEWHLPGPGGQRIVHCSAMVTRATRGGVGIAFDDMAPRALIPLWRAAGAAPGSRLHGRPEALDGAVPAA